MENEVKHQHFWKIEPANGKTSNGICQKCGISKDFLNYIDETMDSYSWRRSGIAKKRKKEEEVPDVNIF
ncbi:MAG: hypothetical protein AABY22_11485 [Nanoarchaeota archaeon]